MYGFPPQRHLLKVHPFLVRLEAATQGLYAALGAQNRMEVIRGLDDTSFWVGRTMAELISASELGLAQPDLFKRGLKEVFAAQLAILEAKKFLGPAQLTQADPSSFLSPTGLITAPLSVKQSKIRNAAQGLHTDIALPRGTIIGSCRIKVKDSGLPHIEGLRADWRSFPIAQRTNHHPVPNMDVVRGTPVTSEALDATYLVANRHIGAGEELTASYRDKGWAEYDYWDNLDFLPLAEFDRNAYQTLVPRSA